jgi:hypothetical protein
MNDLKLVTSLHKEEYLKNKKLQEPKKYLFLSEKFRVVSAKAYFYFKWNEVHKVKESDLF